MLRVTPSFELNAESKELKCKRLAVVCNTHIVSTLIFTKKLRGPEGVFRFCLYLFPLAAIQVHCTCALYLIVGDNIQLLISHPVWKGE